MIVVADTTPLNYLVLIDEILIPREVHLELLHSRSPAIVRTWTSRLPSWCKMGDPISTPDSALYELDAGERDAIQIALETGIDTLLMDDSEGRREAMRRHLRVTGTVAILDKAAQRGLINFRDALQNLQQTNFRLSAKLRDEFLKRYL